MHSEELIEILHSAGDISLRRRVNADTKAELFEVATKTDDGEGRFVTDDFDKAKYEFGHNAYGQGGEQ